MRIGVLRESKDHEQRVALLPGGARELVRAGHRVVVEAHAGEGSGFPDEAYEQAGATLVDGAGPLIGSVDLVVKVKEPTPEEVRVMRPGQALFAFLHLAADPKLAEILLEREVIAVGYENVEPEPGVYPILAPMSEIAGRLSVQIGAHLLQAEQGGRGVLLGGVPGVERGSVLVVGAGIVGSEAIRIAVGMGAEVRALDIDVRRLGRLDELYRGRVSTLYSNAENLERGLLEADLLIGAVLRPGARTPVVVPRDGLCRMPRGSVIVDVAVDQGGCIETTRPTSHSEPTYQVDGVIHYAVPNMPGAVPRTATFGLAHATLPYLQLLAEQGIRGALRGQLALARAVNSYRGEVVLPGLAEALGTKPAEAPWQRA
jgi:alanine dehydrogenase